MRTRKHRSHYLEYAWLTKARTEYSQARQQLEAREVRLCLSDAGMAFVYRVKKAGYPR